VRFLVDDDILYAQKYNHCLAEVFSPVVASIIRRMVFLILSYVRECFAVYQKQGDAVTFLILERQERLVGNEVTNHRQQQVYHSRCD